MPSIEQKIESEPMNRAERYQAVMQLLDQWLADDSGYDEENWPRVKDLLEANRLSDRPLFTHVTQ